MTSRGVLLQVSAAPSAVAELVVAALTATGWRVSARPRDARSSEARVAPGPASGPAGSRLLAERGSLGRTVLLGAFAGRSFHLRAHLALAAGAAGTELRWEWDTTAGVLGGSVGRARALRRHVEAVQQLAEHLRGQGHDVVQREIRERAEHRAP